MRHGESIAAILMVRRWHARIRCAVLVCWIKLGGGGIVEKDGSEKWHDIVNVARRDISILLSGSFCEWNRARTP